MFSIKGQETRNSMLDTFLLLFLKKIQNGSSNSFIIKEIVLP